MTCDNIPFKELAVIIPTYNEKDNVLLLLAKLQKALAGVEWEAIVVDDNSPDGTWQVVTQAARGDSRVRLIRRIGRKGLSSACIEGMLSSSADYLAVIDADLQHDETVLSTMLSLLKKGSLDVVVGSRYVDGGGMDAWPESRVRASRLATNFSKAVTGLLIQDPMSGFFMLRRGYFEGCAAALNGRGFKILLDLLMSSAVPPRFKEVPYKFRLRQHGESKLTMKVVLDYFLLVIQKGIQRKMSAQRG